MSKHTLIIAGSGIKFLSHLTTEVKASIEQSDRVLYLVNDPVLQLWIKNANPSSESLDDLYIKYQKRNDNYLLIAQYIVEQLEHFKTICVVIYGHPTMLVQPSIYAANIAIEKGHEVLVLPGISAEDALYADLLLDPVAIGCQSFEATDFLVYQRIYDPSCHLILWQPYVIGIQSRPVNHNPKKGLQILVEYLGRTYDLNHQVILYEAAQYPAFKPKIDKIPLGSLPESCISRLATLYVPPSIVKQPDTSTVNSLKEISL